MLGTATTSSERRFAILMLTLATVFWGMGFVWAKNVGEATNHAAGVPNGSALGPVLMLSIRFLVASVVWLAIFPRARRGWSVKTFLCGVPIGVVLCVALVCQHLGLDRTTEAVAAFLTNLTVVLVPILVAIISFKRPAANLIVACAVALGGIYLLTGAKTAGVEVGGMDLGEIFVLLSAVGFSIEIVLLGWLMPKDDAARVTVVIFAICGLACGGLAMFLPGFGNLTATALFTPKLVWELGLLTVLCTLVAFGLMSHYQYRIDPTRAAIVYLFEPIVAAAFAWAIEPDAGMTGIQIAGAGLILLANVVAELKWRGP